jgi:membrane protein
MIEELPNPPPKPPEQLTAGELLRLAWQFVFEHEVITRASAIAFSGMMAAVPFLAMLITIVVQFLPDMGPTNAGGGIGALSLEQLEEALKQMFPEGAYQIITDQIARIQSQPPAAIISISVAITLWCASSVYRGIIDAINRVYGVVEARPYWKVWLLSMVMTVVQMAIVIAALVAIILWPSLAGYFGLDTSSWLWGTGVRFLVAFGVVMISFALIFHMGPDVPQRHRWVTPGSIVGTLLFLLTCYGVKLYVSNFVEYDKMYGSLGGVMTLLLWFYLSSLVLLLAAEINRITHYACKRRREIREHRK